MKFIEHPDKGFIEINDNTNLPNSFEIYELYLPSRQGEISEIAIVNCKTILNIEKTWTHPPRYRTTIYFNKIEILPTSRTIHFFIGFLRLVKKGDLKELLDYIELYTTEEHFKTIKPNISKLSSFSTSETINTSQIEKLEKENIELKKRLNEIKKLMEI